MIIAGLISALALTGGFVWLLVKLKKAKENIDGLQTQLDELKTSFNEVVAEELDARAKSEKLFADGLENILNYGNNIPKLTKESIGNGG